MEKTISYIISKDELLTPSHLEDRAMSNFGNMFQLDGGNLGGKLRGHGRKSQISTPGGRFQNFRQSNSVSVPKSPTNCYERIGVDCVVFSR